VTVSKSFEGLNYHFGTADAPYMNFTQLWLPLPDLLEALEAWSADQTQQAA
jgi:hypothetical protein